MLLLLTQSARPLSLLRGRLFLLPKLFYFALPSTKYCTALLPGLLVVLLGLVTARAHSQCAPLTCYPSTHSFWLVCCLLQQYYHVVYYYYYTTTTVPPTACLLLATDFALLPSSPCGASHCWLPRSHLLLLLLPPRSAARLPPPPPACTAGRLLVSRACLAPASHYGGMIARSRGGSTSRQQRTRSQCACAYTIYYYARVASTVATSTTSKYYRRSAGTPERHQWCRQLECVLNADHIDDI